MATPGSRVTPACGLCASEWRAVRPEAPSLLRRVHLDLDRHVGVQGGTEIVKRYLDQQVAGKDLPADVRPDAGAPGRHHLGERLHRPRAQGGRQQQAAVPGQSPFSPHPGKPGSLAAKGCRRRSTSEASIRRQGDRLLAWPGDGHATGPRDGLCWCLCLPSGCGAGDGLAPAGEGEVMALVDTDHHRLDDGHIDRIVRGPLDDEVGA